MSFSLHPPHFYHCPCPLLTLSLKTLTFSTAPAVTVQMSPGNIRRVQFERSQISLSIDIIQSTGRNELTAPVGTRTPEVLPACLLPARDQMEHIENGVGSRGDVVEDDNGLSNQCSPRSPTFPSEVPPDQTFLHCLLPPHVWKKSSRAPVKESHFSHP